MKPTPPEFDRFPPRRPYWTVGDSILLACVVVATLWLTWLVTATPRAADELQYSATVRRNAAVQGVYIHELRAADGTAITVMSDTDLPVSKWLASHRDRRITITLEAK